MRADQQGDSRTGHIHVWRAPQPAKRARGGSPTPFSVVQGPCSVSDSREGMMCCNSRSRPVPGVSHSDLGRAALVVTGLCDIVSCIPAWLRGLPAPAAVCVSVPQMGAEFAAHKTLLELFCYGTWSEYQGRQQQHHTPASAGQQPPQLQHPACCVLVHAWV